MDLVKDDSGDADEDVGTAEEWTNIIDRGGYVKSTTYSLL